MSCEGERFEHGEHSLVHNFTVRTLNPWSMEVLCRSPFSRPARVHNEAGCGFSSLGILNSVAKRDSSDQGYRCIVHTPKVIGGDSVLNSIARHGCLKRQAGPLYCSQLQEVT